MQWERSPHSSSDPAGGYYVFLTDIERDGSNKTRLTQYGPSIFNAWQPIFDAVRGWGEGKNIPCPECP